MLVAGDNRYLSDDLMRLLAVIVQPVSEYAYKVLMAETMSGAVFYNVAYISRECVTCTDPTKRCEGKYHGRDEKG